MKPGDAIEIKRLPYITANEPELIKGLIIAMNSKKSDTTVTIVNTEYGTPIVRQIKIYNPMIQGVRIIQKNFLHKGTKKKVRRAKLYYLLDRDLSKLAVK